MTDTELNEIEAKAKAATPGPWAWNGLSVEANDFDLCSCTDWHSPINRNGTANAAYIAVANPAAILELIAELRQVRKERDWLAEQLAKITDTNKGAWLERAREATCKKN